MSPLCLLLFYPCDFLVGNLLEFFVVLVKIAIFVGESALNHFLK